MFEDLPIKLTGHSFGSRRLRTSEFQEKVKLSKKETAETLSKKILKLEHLHYPQVIEKLLKDE